MNHYTKLREFVPLGTMKTRAEMAAALGVEPDAVRILMRQMPGEFETVKLEKYNHYAYKRVSEHIAKPHTTEAGARGYTVKELPHWLVATAHPIHKRAPVRVIDLMDKEPPRKFKPARNFASCAR